MCESSSGRTGLKFARPEHSSERRLLASWSADSVSLEAANLGQLDLILSTLHATASQYALLRAVSEVFMAVIGVSVARLARRISVATQLVWAYVLIGVVNMAALPLLLLGWLQLTNYAVIYILTGAFLATITICQENVIVDTLGESAVERFWLRFSRASAVLQVVIPTVGGYLISVTSGGFVLFLCGVVWVVGAAGPIIEIAAYKARVVGEAAVGGLTGGTTEETGAKQGGQTPEERYSPITQLKHLLRNRELAASLVGYAIYNSVAATLGGVYYVLLYRTYHFDSFGIGITMASGAACTFFVSYAFQRWFPGLTHRHFYLFIYTLPVVVVALGVPAWIPVNAFVFVVVHEVFLGVVALVVSVGGAHIRASNTPADLLPTVSAIRVFVRAMVIPLFTLLSGIAATQLSSRTAVALIAVYAIFAVIALAVFRNRARVAAV